MMKTFISILFLILVGIEAGAQPSAVHLRYATFNIRYDNPDDGRNNWRFRKDSVARYILDNGVDVVGMQEVLHNQVEFLKKALPGYAMVGVGRDDGATRGEYAPLFYRTDRFEMLESSTFWLSQHPDSIGFIGWDGACTRIATWAKLREKTSGKVFMAVNTHFDHVGVEARKQASLLIIERIKQIVGNRPAILTGDFNVSDASEAYRTLTANAYVLRDAHKIAPKTCGPAFTFHDFGRLDPAQREKIDFIFVSEGIRVLSSEIAPVADGANAFFLSDHAPQLTDIEF